MQWIMILSGLTLLLTAVLLTLLLRRRIKHARCRMMLPGSLLRLFRKTAQLPPASQDIIVLQKHALQLMASLSQLENALHTAPTLPAAPDDEPRLMELALDVADADHFTPDVLINALSAAVPTTAEAYAFPLCVGLAQCRRLSLVLRTMAADARERLRAGKLARNLMHRRKPYAALEQASLNTIGLSALRQALLEHENPEALILLERWLSVHEITFDDLAAQDERRQMQLAEEIRRCESCFSALRHLRWLEHCEAADPLHRLLCLDPAGIYPDMDAPSRLQLRMQIEMYSRHVHMTIDALTRQAMLLCQDAEPGALERYIGYWFQDQQGRRLLHRSLSTRKGILYAYGCADPRLRAYPLLWAFSIFSGFCFLHSGQPVFMLPFFSLTAGDVIRLAVSRFHHPPLPRKAADRIPEHLRTLIVLPALLHDQHDAIRMIRQIKVASQAFSQSHVEYLLLGDFSPAMTAVSSTDAGIIHAASSAAAALSGELPLHYIQRGRTWDGERHVYCARGDRCGAVSELCRLIVQGECEDVIACSTLEPSSLERRFDYLLVLPEGKPCPPGALDLLVQTMSHPLCTRYPIPNGWRGYAVMSWDVSPVYAGHGLIAPDAYLECTDGLAATKQDNLALLGELAGYAHLTPEIPVSAEASFSWDCLLTAARRAWRLLAWQLHWVKTPSGLLNNPLKRSSRFLLREELRQCLLPFGQFFLLLWAVLTQNWLLLVFALAAPELRHFTFHTKWLVQSLCRLSLLPARMLLPLLPLWELLRPRQSPCSMTPSVEIWVQGLSATFFAALGLLIPALAVPALMLAAGFACFPLSHRCLECSDAPAEALHPDQFTLLEDTAASSWRFFKHHSANASTKLIPAFVRIEPGLHTADFTTPQAIGAQLISCVCAKDLGILSAAASAACIRKILTALQDLPLPYGLPCQRYALPSLTVTDAGVSASAVGFLASALLTTAQALRTWLPELPSDCASLSADAEKQLSAMDISRLYDPASGYFHTGLDENGQSAGFLRCFSDDALLLAVVACARKHAPPEALLRLSRLRVRVGKHAVPLSVHGTAAEHLLSGLFLPTDAHDAQAFIHAMMSRGRSGLFGQSQCSAWRFDARLNYQQVCPGVSEASLRPTPDEPVYTPYAAALALPFMPQAAANAIAQFCAAGARGPDGVCDAVDLNSGAALIRLYDAYHMGLLLGGISHCLADAPLRRYFCSLPEVEACLPLLTRPAHGVTLPAFACIHPAAAKEESAPFPADRGLSPIPMQILGNDDFRLLCDAHQQILMTEKDVPLNTALHFYLLDEGRIYHLGNPSMQGDASFAPGESRYEQICGSLSCHVIHCADTLRLRALHIITITNLSTRDRKIEVADCLLPDLSAPLSTMEPVRSEAGRLTLHARGASHTLCHTISSSAAPLKLTACTDLSRFTGRGQALHQPRSLTCPACDQVQPSAAPCLSFRSQYALGGRGQITLWFTTSLRLSDPPPLTELEGVRQLAAMQDAAIDHSVMLCAPQREMGLLLTAPLQSARWRLSIMTDDQRPAFMPDLIALLGWLLLHGQKVSLRIHCTKDTQTLLTEQILGMLADEQVEFAAPDAASYPLVLTASRPLPEQLRALYERVIVPNAAVRKPHPALLPSMTLHCPGPYGGFDPDTMDYVLQLPPGLLPPEPWSNTHMTPFFREETDENGLHAPFHEEIWLRMENGTLLSPWSPELPRSIRMRPAQTVWQAWSEQLDLRLQASCLPDCRCGLRALHIHNASDTTLSLTLHVLARLESPPLLRADGLIMTDDPSRRLQAYLAGDSWQSSRVRTPWDSTVCSGTMLEQADTTAGDTAHLFCSITLSPHRSSKVMWLAGYARHGEEIAKAMESLRNSTASALLRAAQEEQQHRLSLLRFSTQENTLDLLVNRILPLQGMSAEGVACVPVLMYLAPGEARRALLQRIRQPMSADDWAHFILMTADYIRVTEDTALLSTHLPAQDASYLACCRSALLEIPLSAQHLPLGSDQAYRCFLYSCAAQALHHLAPDPALLEFSRRLLNAADTYLWQDNCYGMPLRLDVQSLACEAYGATPRTCQAISACWSMLYDRPAGLIRLQLPTDAAPLPGLPENGGMITLEAVRFLRSLLKTSRYEDAFELLRALNPIHHTDTPQRQAVFRCAPYQLPAGMHASPMEPGRAVPGGDEAAALLYAVILEDVLGFHRRGDHLTLKPCIPDDWDDFAVTLHMGTATWHISAERRIRSLFIDGEISTAAAIHLQDDGRVHQVRFPLA